MLKTIRRGFTSAFAEAARISNTPQIRKVWKEGDICHGFIVKNVKEVKELQLTAVELSHVKTGAKYMHVERADSNNVFSVALKTAPTDSTGVPHILEHTVLCGSRNYPVRDPFFKMLNRSMATYMNAWTASDWTMYPFSAVNSKDLENLRRVYMDAVFFPLIKKSDFQQEGWRLEHEVLDDKNSAIAFKGVVYNEMKGAFSDIGSLFCTRLQQHLLPNSTYAIVSGGDPKHITSLTHEQLVNFHKENYHPSNSRFFTYGDYPLEKHLEYIDGVFAEFSPIDPPNVKMHPDAFKAPKRVFEQCPPDPLGDPKKQTKMCVAYVMNDSSDVYECFVMRLMSYLLMNGQASPMHKTLIQSNIGNEFSPGAGYDDSTQVATFSVGLQGIKSEDVDNVEKLIMNVFEKVKQEGFEDSRIEAALHQIELGMKHRTANFGLGLAQNLITSWIHDANPINGLEVNKNIERLRREMKENRQFFQDRIQKYFFQNQNRLTFAMSPSVNYNEQLKMEEQARLSSKVKSLSEEEKVQVYLDGLELAKLQDQKQDVSCLPRLQVEDLPRENRCLKLQHEIIQGIPVQLRVSETNEITYFRALATFENLPLHLRSVVPLFSSSLVSLGTNNKSAAEFDEEIRLYTGGIGASPFLSTCYSNLEKLQQGIIVSGNCLDKNVPKLYELLREATLETNFGNKKELKTLIRRSATNMMNSVAESGHMFARKLAASSLLPSSFYSEIYGGLKQVEWMNQLAINDDMDHVVSRLRDLSDYLYNNTQLRLALTVSNENGLDYLKSSMSKFPFPNAQNVQPSDNDLYKKDYGFIREPGSMTWIKTPFATNFTAKCFTTVPFDHHDVIPLRLLASLLSHNYLHKEIREKNGAYGGGAAYSTQDGLFSFYSYRDPNPKATLETFSYSGEWAARQKFTQEQLDEAKLTLFGQLDSPISASAEGMRFFQDRITDQMKQKYRDAIFTATPEDITRVAREYLLDNGSESASIAVLGGQDTELPSADLWNIKQLSPS